MTDKTVIIYTDGACSGNPGPGGWGAIMMYNGHTKEIFGGAQETTNNRMEMTAAIEALKTLKRKCNVHIHTDSVYLKDGITKWLSGWKNNNWKTAAKKPVKNSDLWQELDVLNERHVIKWSWVKGHNGHEYNERADELANLGLNDFK